MLLKTQARAKCCKQWEDFTPNEYFDQNSDYRKLVLSWGKQSDLPSVRKCIEVRVTKTHSELSLHKSVRWWDDPKFMDSVFWVYVKTLIANPDDPEKRRSFYALEYYECQRVKDEAIKKFGYNPFTFMDIDGTKYVDHEPSFLIPCDCTEIAWTDTKGGYATNIRDGAVRRANAPVPNEVVEYEHMVQEVVEKKSKELHDVANDPKWQNDL